MTDPTKDIKNEESNNKIQEVIAKKNVEDGETSNVVSSKLNTIEENLEDNDTNSSSESEISENLNSEEEIFKEVKQRFRVVDDKIDMLWEDYFRSKRLQQDTKKQITDGKEIKDEMSPEKSDSETEKTYPDDSDIEKLIAHFSTTSNEDELDYSDDNEEDCHEDKVGLIKNFTMKVFNSIKLELKKRRCKIPREINRNEV